MTKYSDGFILNEHDMSFDTPIAKVLWGKKVGYVIDYIIGRKKKKLEILRVE